MHKENISLLPNESLQFFSCTKQMGKWENLRTSLRDCSIEGFFVVLCTSLLPFFVVLRTSLLPFFVVLRTSLLPLQSQTLSLRCQNTLSWKASLRGAWKLGK